MSETSDAPVAPTSETSGGDCPHANGNGRAPYPVEGGGNQGWWPNRLNLKILAKNPAVANPLDEELRLRRGVQVARPRRRQAGSRGGADHVAGLVARRLRALRPADHPDGLAQRGHLPHQRRPRRRRRGPAALRSPEQLAGQREPRQGTPAAVAGQAEVRPEHLVGRPDDPRRQRRAGVDGLQDLRLRRRPRGRLGAGRGRLLGPRDGLARTTSATAATGSSRTRWPPCRWA